MRGAKIYPAVSLPLPSTTGRRRSDSDCSSSIHSDLAHSPRHNGTALTANEAKDAVSDVGLMLSSSTKSHGLSSKSGKLAQQQQLIREKLVNEIMDEILPDIGSYADGSYNKVLAVEDSWRVKYLKLVGCIAMDLHEAVLSGSLHEVRRTLRKICTGSEAKPQMVNDYDQEGRTALSLAAKLNQMPICAELIENNAIVECPDEGTGRTPLYYAVRNRNHDLTKLLLSNGARSNTADMQCVTPLMIACTTDDHRHAKALCDANADVDMQDERGWTALHYAVTHDAQRCLKILLREGADKDLRDMNQRKPIHFAKFHNYGNCIALLSDNGQLMG